MIILDLIFIGLVGNCGKRLEGLEKEKIIE